LSIGAPGAGYLHPSPFTVATEGYALSRRLYLYLPVQNVKPLALEFVNFALSSEGQEGVRAAGFVDLTLYAAAGSPCDPCPTRYASLTRLAKRVSLDFRFRSGSAELDSRGLRDLDRLLDFLRKTPARAWCWSASPTPAALRPRTPSCRSSGPRKWRSS
jgi:phosphate transport system substrate-binding protein